MRFCSGLNEFFVHIDGFVLNAPVALYRFSLMISTTGAFMVCIQVHSSVHNTNNLPQQVQSFRIAMLHFPIVLVCSKYYCRDL